MEEIKILIDDDVNSNKSDSKDTPRKEQPWESRSEVYLRKIMNACNDISKEHDTEAKQYRLRYKILVIPTIVLPVMLSALDEVIRDYKYISIIGLLFVGLFSGLNAFFNYGGRAEIHNNFSDKYEGIKIMIESELAKPKKFRVAIDVFQKQCDLNFIHLNCSSPPI